MLAKVAQIGQHIFYRWPGAWGQPAAFSGHYIGEPRDPLAMRPLPTTVSQSNPAVEIASAEAGQPVRRAPNDVGGLLDTTKGWRLNIPVPDESDGAAARMIAAQQSGRSSIEVAAATSVTPATALVSE